VLTDLRERGVRWISEPEFAFRFLDGALIAVTGTNGKTTTAALTAHLLDEAGVSVALGGKAFGPPMCDLVRRGGAAWYVVELSSFQLADIDALRPDIGVVTGLAPDHLDRYPSVEAYWADKARLFRNADPDSRWVLPHGDEDVTRLAGEAPGTRYTFGEDAPDAHAFVSDTRMTLCTQGETSPLITVDELPLLGRHNVRNALAAALTARLAGVSPDAIAGGLRTAPGLPHRMERVARTRDVLWVNDSKATNVAAARAACESLPGPLVVLLGGKDKGEDFAPLSSALRGTSSLVVVYGEAAGRIAAELDDDLPVERVKGMSDAVALAAGKAHEGDTVLLSPACSSFDEFENYEARGETFRALVLRLAEGSAD